MDDDIQMDGQEEHEHEHEHEPIDEPEYDDDDVDVDVDADEDDDDMDDDDADDGDADADDADADDDDDGASRSGSGDDASVAASRTGLRRSTTDEALSSATYLRKVSERRSLFHPPPACINTSLGYQIEPMAAAPHSSQIHAMALSLDGQTLLTGGADGFIRKYDIHATMNGKTMLTQNVRHGFVEGITRGGSLTAFWPNEEHLTSIASSHIAEKDRLVGVVHSLAIQQDALWALSGSESGNIHLTTIRHDPGSTRHVFRKHKGAVSALALTSDETTMISGGWDRGVHQWDLNVGQVIRSFPGHAGQISSLSFRPLAPQSQQGRERSVSIHPSAAEARDAPEHMEEDDDRARNERVTAAGDDAMEDAKQGGDEANKDTERKEGEDETSKAAAGDEKDTNTEQADAPTATSADSIKPSADEAKNDATAEQNDVPSGKPQPENNDPASVVNGTTNSDSTAANGTVEKAPVGASTPVDKSNTPAPDADPSAESSGSPPTEIKKESDPTAPSSGAPGDDPTEEELAFEAELNASLGMSLDGSGGTKADGTRAVDGVGGTTAGGLMVAGADQDLDDAEGDDLFGGDTPPASSSATNKEKEFKGEANGAGGSRGAGGDSDGDDSLFGGDDEDADGDMDADGDADGDADADADEDGDADADGDEDEDDGSSDEDMPLAGRAMVKNPSSQSLAAANTPIGTASPSLSIALPTTAPTTAASARDTKPLPTTVTPSTPPKKALPKPAFGGFDQASSYTAPLSTFSPDVMLSTSLSGQVILWDLRCPNYTSSSSSSEPAKGVHSLPLPSKTPPWCQSAIFNSTGDRVFVGRRNESVDEWDLRMPTSARFIRSLRLPSGSGPVYSLAAMPNSRHIVCGSYDNIRLWDTQFQPGPTAAGELRVPFKIVAGHHGATLSSVVVDKSCKFLISASGDRGWMGSSTEAVIVHDIKALM